MTQKTSWLLLDLDDTLIVEEPAADDAILQLGHEVADRHGIVAERFRLALRRSARRRWWGHPDHPYARRIGISSWEALWARFEGDVPELNRFRGWAPEYRLGSWTDALEAVGVDDPVLAGELADRYPETRRRLLRPFDDSIPFLERLRDVPSLALGLVTNGLVCLQREKIRATGLEDRFDVTVISGEVGRGKPDPAPFLAAMERLGADPRRTVMIGNSLEKDVAGAEAAGITGLWLDRTGAQPVPPDLPPERRLRRLADWEPR